MSETLEAFAYRRKLNPAFAGISPNKGIAHALVDIIVKVYTHSFPCIVTRKYEESQELEHY